MILHFVSSAISGQERVIVPEALVEELADLRIAFAKLLYNYEKKLQSNHRFQSLFNKLAVEHVSLFNTHYLKQLCSIFPEDIW